jgi:hypothetical protein
VLDSIVLSEGAEVTFECNPETVDGNVFETLKNAGVNRLSFGVQSLNDTELSALGRIHSADRAIAAITEAARPLLTGLSVTVTDLKSPASFIAATAVRTSLTFSLPDSFFAPSEKMKRSDSFASLQAVSAL